MKTHSHINHMFIGFFFSPAGLGMLGCCHRSMVPLFLFRFFWLTANLSFPITYVSWLIVVLLIVCFSYDSMAISEDIEICCLKGLTNWCIRRWDYTEDRLGRIPLVHMTCVYSYAFSWFLMWSISFDHRRTYPYD